MSADDWEQSITVRIGAAVKSLRGKRRSAQWLAEETARLGYPIGRATISEIENGRRRTITVAELLILARALNTSPVALVFPTPTDDLSEVVEVLPNVESTGFQAAQWFSGHGRSGFTDSTDGAQSASLRAEFKENTRLLTLARMIADWREQLYSIVTPIGGELTEQQRQFRAHCENQIELLQNELQAAIDGDD